jgi:hypothetical protein
VANKTIATVNSIFVFMSLLPQERRSPVWAQLQDC